MFTVTILGFDHALASAITGAMDLFSLAGISWQRIQGTPPAPLFQVQLASKGKKAVRCTNSLTLTSQIAIEEVEHTDLLLIPTIGGHIDQVLTDNQALLKYICWHHNQGADIASNCSGTFLLAEAGLLDNKEATTHWGYASLFKSRYPRVKLCADKLITRHDNLFCAGGGMAWFDLALLLIERYGGHDIAAKTAKAHVLDLARGTQAAYAQIDSRKYHQDEDIRLVQEFLESQYANTIAIETLPARFNLSARTFNRRFKAATEQTPIAYLQNIRTEAAKKMLESSSVSLEQLVTAIGYEDLSSFTRLFKRKTGLSPSQYRKKFRRG